MILIKIMSFAALVGLIVGVATLVSYGVIVLVYDFFAKIRKRKTNRRIIEQAKAAGVWDNPKILANKALELKAWKEYKIKRKPGETDAALRIRCMNAADKEIKER